MVITSPERDLRSVCLFMFQCELFVVCHDQLNDQLVTHDSSEPTLLILCQDLAFIAMCFLTSVFILTMLG